MTYGTRLVQDIFHSWFRSAPIIVNGNVVQTGLKEDAQGHDLPANNTQNSRAIDAVAVGGLIEP